MLTFNKPRLSELKKSWADILHVGIPAAATNPIIPVATGVITAMLATYGPGAVAGFGVGGQRDPSVRRGVGAGARCERP